MYQTDLAGRCGTDALPAPHPHEGDMPRPAPLSPAPVSPAKGRAAIVWGVGSTLLSVLGFLGWGLFEQYNHSLAELQRDLKRFNELSSGLVTKDAMQRLREQLRAVRQEQQAAGIVRAHLEKELVGSEKAREAMTTDLLRIRERLAFVEGQHSALHRDTGTCPPERNPDDGGDRALLGSRH